ncbi:hypothetical protein BsWGS_28287 [Bradybaena similaris]
MHDEGRGRVERKRCEGKQVCVCVRERERGESVCGRGKGRGEKVCLKKREREILQNECLSVVAMLCINMYLYCTFMLSFSNFDFILLAHHSTAYTTAFVRITDTQKQKHHFAYRSI